MAQARQAERSLPQAAFLLPATLAVALVLGVIVAFGIIAAPRIDLGALGNETSPTVIQSGQDWEAQRQMQSVFGSAVIQSGQDWEAQREQQSGGYADPVTRSGQDWQTQREQQSGHTPR